MVITTVLLTTQLQAQPKIKGCLSEYSKQKVSLFIYKGFRKEQVATTTTDSVGNFSFDYPNDYQGVVFLQISNLGGIEILLNNANTFTIKGSSIQNIDSLHCIKNTETNALYTYYSQQLAREKALSGWRYLKQVYKNVPYLQQQKQNKLISKQISLLENERKKYLQSQPAKSYLRWYLPLVSLVRDIPVSVMRYQERIPEHIDFFMHTNFSDQRFYNSGLMSVVMDKYFFMLENMGKPLDSIYVEMNHASDYIIETIEEKRPEWLEEVGMYLFKLFEKRSLFTAAEHLSISMLDQTKVQLSDDARNRFEGYRTMKKGNTAPDIDFSKAIALQKAKGNDSLQVFLKNYTSLSSINSKYKLIIFGESDCPDCQRQMKKIESMYPQLLRLDVKVVYVSLDSSVKTFKTSANKYPWISYFDYNGWDSKPVLDYHVFASPTIYLLGDNLKILYKIVSPEHLGAVLKVLK
jgi:hypothetical protein